MFGFINDLNKAMMKVEEQAVMFTILEGLIEYTKKHFKDEEDNLRMYDFPELTVHVEEHQKLTESVMGFSEEFAEDSKNYDEYLSIRVMSFLFHWIIDHILESDKKYSEFLNGKEIIGEC